MDADRWNHVDELLRSAVDRPAAERDGFLRGNAPHQGILTRNGQPFKYLDLDRDADVRDLLD